jgi:predicted metal-dependent peptidase
MITPEDKALSKAKIALMQRPDSTFFLTVCFSLPIHWDKSINTACTNGKNILINPDFFMSLNGEEQLFLLLHETLHVAYMHMHRLQERQPKKWNIAADYVINYQLTQSGYRMPKNGLLDTKWAGMSTEEVYKNLPDSSDIEVDMDLLEPESTDEELAKDIQDILVRASVASKMANDKPGSIPGEIQIYLNSLLNPVLPWNRILQKYFNGFAKDDYSFRKPNRRFFPKYHLPSLHSEKLMNLVVAVDTSGSVSDHDFHVFVSEVASILRMMKPEKITLIQFDTDIKSVTEIKSIQDLKECKFTGRGGTRIEPVMEWALNANPQLTMVFSDGEFRYSETKPPGDVLWVVHNNTGFKPSFGKVIHYSI